MKPNEARMIRLAILLIAGAAITSMFADNLDDGYKSNCYNESHIQGNQATCCDSGCKDANPGDPSGQQSCYDDCMSYNPQA